VKKTQNGTKLSGHGMEIALKNNFIRCSVGIIVHSVIRIIRQIKQKQVYITIFVKINSVLTLARYDY